MMKIYYLNLMDCRDLPDDFFKTWLPESSRKRIAGFRNDKVRRSKMLGESMVRSILFRERGMTPEDYSIVLGEHGKPYVVGMPEPFYFNISHSGDYVVCAVSDREIGIDIERIGKVRMEVARRFFHPEEIKVLEALPESRQTDAFFSYWSVKEAFLKYTGAGLSASLSVFEVLFEGNRVRVQCPGGAGEVWIRACPVDEEYKCYVCSAMDELPEIYCWRGTDYTFPQTS